MFCRQIWMRNSMWRTVSIVHSAFKVDALTRRRVRRDTQDTFVEDRYAYLWRIACFTWHTTWPLKSMSFLFPMVSFYNQVLFVILGLSLRRSPCLFERKWWVLCILVFPFLCQVHGTFGSSAAASLFFSCFITDRQSVTGWFVNIAANHLRWKVREFDFFDDEATHVLILHEHRSSGGWNFLVA